MALIEATKTSSLPPYSEMILDAVKALNEKSGSNKTSICQYLESKYAERLPDSFYNLMVAELARMKECGEIVQAKNNYYVPGIYAPPTRERGRPPKPKDPSKAESGPPKPKRRRGRPPKSEGENNAEAEDKTEAKAGDEAVATPKSKERGRPQKKAKSDEENVPSKSEAGVNDGAVQKGRGRPPKLGI